MPLHAKYAQPFHARQSGWRWLLSARVDVEVPRPWALVRCPGAAAHARAAAERKQRRRQSSGGDEQQQQQQQQDEAERRLHAALGGWLALRPPTGDGDGDGGGAQPPLLWALPAGNLDHEAAVALATTAATFAAAGAIVWAALAHARGASSDGGTRSRRGRARAKRD